MLGPYAPAYQLVFHLCLGVQRINTIRMHNTAIASEERMLR